jgi:hypothetical protein
VRYGDLTKETYVTPHILVDVYRHFGGTCCLHPSSLRLEAGHCFSTTVNIYRITRRPIPVEGHLHCREITWEI